MDRFMMDRKGEAGQTMNAPIPDLTELLKRPIAFQRPYAEIAGSAAGGLFLSQAVYWSGKSKHEGGWFYVSQEQWYEQAMLKRSEQERARKELKKVGVLEEKRKGNPARLWYRINKDQLNCLLYKYIEKQQIVESSNQECRNQQSSMQDSTNCPDTPFIDPAEQGLKPQEKQQIADADKQVEVQENRQFAESSNQECSVQQSSMQDSANFLTESTTESNSENTDSDTEIVRETSKAVFQASDFDDCNGFIRGYAGYIERCESKGTKPQLVKYYRLFGFNGRYVQEAFKNHMEQNRSFFRAKEHCMMPELKAIMVRDFEGFNQDAWEKALAVQPSGQCEPGKYRE